MGRTTFIVDDRIITRVVGRSRARWEKGMNKAWSFRRICPKVRFWSLDPTRSMKMRSLDSGRSTIRFRIHMDPVAAANEPFGGVIASGINTLSIYQRLFVTGLRASGGVGRALNVRFLRPVYPGTTLTGRSTVRKVTVRPDRGNAIVEFDTLLVNDSGEQVLSVHLDALLYCRASCSSDR